MSIERLNEIAAVPARGRVDRSRGIIFAVKVLGRRSANGREYTTACLSQAVGLYEGAKVYVDHPSDGRAAVRSYRDQIAVLRSARLDAGALRADLHINLKHELAGQLLFDAEHAPDAVGLSHVVDGQTRRGRDGKTIVERIIKVFSVDLVTAPATAAGLFEGEDPLAEKARLVEAVAAEIGLPARCVPGLTGGLGTRHTVETIREYLSGIKAFLIDKGLLPGKPPRLVAVDRGIYPIKPDAERDRFRQVLDLPADRNGDTEAFLAAIT